MSVVGTALKGAGKWSMVGRLIAIAEVALVAKHHLENLDKGEGTELRGLIAKSKGRPGNLTKSERTRLGTLVKKLDPAAFARNAAKTAVPLGKKT
jgi:hypothetical protein